MSDIDAQLQQVRETAERAIAERDARIERAIDGRCKRFSDYLDADCARFMWKLIAFGELAIIVSLAGALLSPAAPQPPMSEVIKSRMPERPAKESAASRPQAEAGGGE